LALFVDALLVAERAFGLLEVLAAFFGGVLLPGGADAVDPTEVCGFGVGRAALSGLSGRRLRAPGPGTRLVSPPASHATVIIGPRTFVTVPVRGPLFDARLIRFPISDMWGLLARTWRRQGRRT
jgi:hypothetical protein